MFDDGLYSLDYRAIAGDPMDAAGTALAVLRNGKILGADRFGAMFAGSYEFDAGAQSNRVHIRMSLPPGGELVTGQTIGAQGAVVDIVGGFDRAQPVARTTIEVAGAPVEVRLTYLGPLPN